MRAAPVGRAGHDAATRTWQARHTLKPLHHPADRRQGGNEIAIPTTAPPRRPAPPSPLEAARSFDRWIRAQCRNNRVTFAPSVVEQEMEFCR